MIQGGQSTGTSTKRNAIGSSSPKSVRAWTTIMADLPHFNDAIAVQLHRTLPGSKRVTAESDINTDVTRAAVFVSNSCSD
jgi:hypothetical protein